jgi:hypothetical protein
MQETARTPRNKTVILTIGLWMTAEELCNVPLTMPSPPVPVILPAAAVDELLPCNSLFSPN